MYKTLLYRSNGKDLVNAYVLASTLEEQLSALEKDSPLRELVSITAVPDGAVVVVRDVVRDHPDWSHA